jgi:hypothetical protein
MDFGSACKCREGVLAPGVAGGVNAGESRLFGRPGVGGPWSARSLHVCRRAVLGRGTGDITGEA